MKFIIKTKDINDAVSSTSKIIKNHTPIEILRNILISADKNGIIKLRATDLQTTIEKTIDAEVEQSGEATVDGKLLASWLANIKYEAITIHMEGTDLILQAGRATIAFPTLPADQFPPIQENDIAENIKLNARALKAAVLATSFAASTEEARGATLMGTLIKSGKDGTTLVCTDGYRLALQTNNEKQDVETQSIIPTGALIEVARNVGDADLVEATILGQNKNQIKIMSGRTTIYVRLVDGNYPNYQQVLPKSMNRTVTLKTTELLDALKRTVLVSSDRSSMIIMSVKKDEISINANSTNTGRANESVEAEVVGEDLEICLNARYFTDILNHINSVNTILEFSGPLIAVIIRPAKTTPETDQKYVLMPLRK